MMPKNLEGSIPLLIHLRSLKMKNTSQHPNNFWRGTPWTTQILNTAIVGMIVNNGKNLSRNVVRILKKQNCLSIFLKTTAKECQGFRRRRRKRRRRRRKEKKKKKESKEGRKKGQKERKENGEENKKDRQTGRQAGSQKEQGKGRKGQKNNRELLGTEQGNEDELK